MKGNIQFSVSTFGEIPLDTTTNVQIIVPDKDNNHGCEPFDVPKDLKAEKFVWLVRRGDCTYLKKAKNSQFSGAYAVIVVHDNPNINIEDVIPYADSNFKSVHTPIVLIKKQDGDELFENLNNSSKIGIMALTIELEAEKRNVDNMELWISPSSIESYDLLVQMEEIYNNFGKYLEFKPKYKFHDFRESTYDSNFKSKNCFGNGEFCALHTPNYHSHSILNEALRQSCLWQIDRDKKYFWRYIQKYRVCLKQFTFHKKAKTNCHEQGFLSAQVPSNIETEIKSCITNSFDNPDDPVKSPNSILKSHKNSSLYSEIYLVPAIMINGELLMEELVAKNVTVALCDELINKPSLCEQYNLGNNKFIINSNAGSGLLKILFVSVFFTLILVILLFMFFRKSLNNRVDRELYMEINQHVTNYMKISN